jgi:hypothetical protein
MLYVLTARVYNMVINHDVELEDACSWILRNMPKGLQAYYERQIFTMLIDTTC